MNIEKKDIERKILTEECWIDLGDGLGLRIDYPTRGQEAEYRRLDALWAFNAMMEQSEQPINYYLRCACKQVRGLTIENEEASIEVKNGLAKNLVFKGGQVDFIDFLVGANLWYRAWFDVKQKLAYDDIDKKKLQSQPDSTEKESSENIENLSGKA
jgi:hypothetical protein